MNLAKSWEIKMKKANHQFAMIQTNRAIFDIAAITANLPTMLTIQYLKGSSRRKNLSLPYNHSENFSIRQENISKRDIKKIQYYKD